VPFLRAWEQVDRRWYSTGCDALGLSWQLEPQPLRAIAQHSLRLLGEEPLGFATYHFRQSEQPRLAVPEWLTDREERSGRLRQEMSAFEVLELLGSPDHIAPRTIPVGTEDQWVETWEYDLRRAGGWDTLALSWQRGEPSGRLIRIERTPADWTHTDRRELEILWD
jgi:hypothetical protein